MSTYKSTLLLTIFALISITTKAQEVTPIQSDRPGISISSATVGKGVLQLQSGIRYNHSNIPFVGLTMGQRSPINQLRIGISQSTVLRYGILDRFELSAVSSMQFEKQVESGLGVETTTQNGYYNYELGGKVLILKGDERTPQIGLQSRVGFQSLTNPNYRIPNRYFVTTLAVSQNVGNRLHLTGNVYAQQTSIDAPIQNGGSLQVGVQMNDHWSFFGESFYESEYTFGFDGGVMYRPNSNVMFDLSGGVNDASVLFRNYFVDLGLSARLAKF